MFMGHDIIGLHDTECYWISLGFYSAVCAKDAHLTIRSTDEI